MHIRFSGSFKVNSNCFSDNEEARILHDFEQSPLKPIVEDLLPEDVVVIAYKNDAGQAALEMFQTFDVGDSPEQLLNATEEGISHAGGEIYSGYSPVTYQALAALETPKDKVVPILQMALKTMWDGLSGISSEIYWGDEKAVFTGCIASSQSDKRNAFENAVRALPDYTG